MPDTLESLETELAAYWKRHGKVTVVIEGVKGEASTSFPRGQWDGMAAISRCLAIHDALRHVTDGKPFNVNAVIREA